VGVVILYGGGVDCYVIKRWWSDVEDFKNGDEGKTI